MAINPATPLSTLSEILPFVDLVLVMSVNPGFGGQKLIPQALNKITDLEKIRRDNSYGFKIEIDGGVNRDNLGEVRDAGTDIIVAGSAVFGADDIEETVRDFCGILENKQ